MNNLLHLSRELVDQQIIAARQAGQIPDLSGADLAGLDLSLMDLSQARLRQANLRGANLRNANLAEADLSGSNLQAADLRQANLTRTCLNEADLCGANLAGCDLGTTLTDQAHFDQADLTGAKLRSHWFFKVSAKRAIFNRADLSSAQGEECDFGAASFAAANLAQTHFMRSNFNAANLNGAELRVTRLPNTDLRHATLLNADLSSAHLPGADLSAADLSGADLRKAELTTCKAVGTIFKDVVSDEHTAWPEAEESQSKPAVTQPKLSLRWEIPLPEEQQPYLGFAGGGIDDLALTPDGRFIVCVSRLLRQVLVIDFTSVQRVQSLSLHTGDEQIAGLAITADSHFALLTTNHTLRYVALDEEALTPPGVAQPEPPTLPWVHKLTLSPNGRFLLLSNDQTIELYDHRHMRPAYFLDTQGLTGEGQPLTHSICISADSRLAFAAVGSTLAAWDMPGKQKLCQADTGSSVTALALLPGEQVLLVGHASGAIDAWDWQQARKTAELPAASSREQHNGAVTALGITPDGRWVLSAGEDGTLKIWEVQTRRLVHNLGGHAAAITGLALSPDSQYAITCGADTLLNKWHIPSGRLVGQVLSRQSDPGPATINADSQWALAPFGVEQRSLGVYSLENGELRHHLNGHQGRINALAFLADGRHLLSASDDHLLLLWNLQTGQIDHAFAGHNRAVTHLVIAQSPGLIVSAGRDGCLITWDLRSGKPDRPLLHYPLPGKAQDYAVQLSPDAQFAIVNIQPPGEPVQAALYNLQSGQKSRSLRTSQCLFSPDGLTLACFEQFDSLRLINLETQSERRISAQGELSSKLAAFTPDERYLIALRPPQQLAIIDVLSGRIVGQYSGHTAPLIALALDPGGKTAFSLDSQRYLRLWQIPSGAEIDALQLAEPASTLVVAPDGRSLVVGGMDGRLLCVEIKT